MKLVSFMKNNKISIGALDNETIIPFTNNPSIPKDMLSFLEMGDDALNMAQEAVSLSKSNLTLGECKLLSPILRPPKIIAIGLNYQDHLEEIRACLLYTSPSPRD